MSVHVYPVHDLQTHDTDGLTCWCEPRVEFVHAETGVTYPDPIVIHNSSDCREAVEQAEDIIKKQAPTMRA